MTEFCPKHLRETHSWFQLHVGSLISSYAPSGHMHPVNFHTQFGLFKSAMPLCYVQIVCIPKTKMERLFSESYENRYIKQIKFYYFRRLKIFPFKK